MKALSFKVTMEKTVKVVTPYRWVRTFRRNKVSIFKTEGFDCTVSQWRAKWRLGDKGKVVADVYKVGNVRVVLAALE
jgi:hypothetical protein